MADTNEKLEAAKNAILEEGKKQLDIFLELLKDDGQEALVEGQKFVALGKNLLQDVATSKITQAEFVDGIEDIKLALSSYLLAEGLKKADIYLKALVSALKSIASVAITILLALV